MDSEKTTKCIECRNEFRYEPIFLHGAEVFARNRCGSCLAAVNARAEDLSAKLAAEARLAKWHGICPPLYRDTDIARIAPACGRAALAWTIHSARGMGLLGKTGTGKTRALFIALQRAFDGGKSCRAVSHNAFSRTVQTAFAGELRERDEAKRTLDGLQQCDVLLLDDVGKPPPTERADAELEELIEVRTCNMKPILWSANGSAAWLVQRMGADRGEPLVRRLSEFCEIITA